MTVSPGVSMYTTKNPLAAAADAPRFSLQGEKPLPGAKSDYQRKTYYDDEGRYPIPQSKRSSLSKQR